MKKYYRVGFKGLDPKEKNQKEMKLNKDKKRIIVGKKETDLMEISEKDEDNFNEEVKNDFFKGGKEQDEIETTYKKSTKKKMINDYKEFVSNTERADSEAALNRGSRRQTSSDKFFGAPPKKRSASNKPNKPRVDPFIFMEKDQQKIGRKEATFFSGKLDKPTIGSKQKDLTNIFQKNYDNIYNPKFKGPKVVSENLGFYIRDTIDFENDAGDENKHPPYYGGRFKKMKKKRNEDEDSIETENAGLRVGFVNKNRQIDLDDNDEEMPKLAKNLTFEQKMEEFHQNSVYFTTFLKLNIASRHILVTTFDRMSIVYSRYQRAGNFTAQLSLFAFFLSIFFTNDEKEVAFETGDLYQVLYLLLYCFASEVFACLVVHLPAYCFWVNDKKFRKLYNTVREDGGITVLKDIEDIVFKGRLFWNILGVVIQIIFIVMGFYFSFGFCATYYYQRYTYILALICTIAFDFTFGELGWEVIIGFLYYFRDVGRIIVFFGTLFNTMRNIKHLV